METIVKVVKINEKRNWFQKLLGLNKFKPITRLTKNDFVISEGNISHCSEYYDKKQTGRYLLKISNSKPMKFICDKELQLYNLRFSKN